MNNPQVLILAGGEGKRFYPLTKDKSIFPFLGRPLIYHQIKMIKEAGLKEIAVVANPVNQQLIKKTAEQFKQVQIKVVVQRQAKGMGQAILCAENKLSAKPVLIVNSGDLLKKTLYEKILNLIEHQDPEAVIPGYQTESYFPGGYLETNADLITSIIEKPGEGNQPSNLVNLVAHYYKNPEILLSELKQTETDRDDHYEKAIDKLISSGVRFHFVSYSGVWKYLKYPWHVLGMMQVFLKSGLNEQNKAEYIAPNAQIEGPVYLGKGVKVFSGAKIKGPVYIGEDVLIGDNALVRSSQIGKGSVVGSNTEIARSCILDNCWFHRNYVGDSVIDTNVSFGAGTVTANFRLDEHEVKVKKDKKVDKDEKVKEQIDTSRKKLGAVVGANVRVGVNTSIMPGTFIGTDSFVGPGLVLGKNIKPGKFCKLDSKLTIVDNKTQVLERKQFK
jgi:bifunctional UDP-N-acetylglucosamine pyrophosphorylase/glucosamine-1-phosphate N-acetyltransferase